MKFHVLDVNLTTALNIVPDEPLESLLGLLQLQECGIHVLPLLVLELEPGQPL